MDFKTAVQTCFSNFATFSGRARRSEFWYFALFGFVVRVVASFVDAVAGTDWSAGSGLFQWLTSLVLLLPSLAVAVRRLHDINRSGWWILVGLIPIVGWIVLIVWYAKEGDSGANEHGPDPKGAASSDVPPAAPYGGGRANG